MLESVAAAAVVVPNNLAVQGNNNIALGTNAGQGTGSAFSDTIAIGTGATASQSTAVAIGAAASANAPGSVALGAGSVANEANTVSVGSAGAERRITNVAPGVAATDAATYGQLTSAVQSTQTEIQQVNTNANAGVAMAMAQAGAAGVSAPAGRTAVGVGSGFYQGQTAVGLGVASANPTGSTQFKLAAAISPGVNQVGVQVGMNWLVGPGMSHPANTAPAMQSTVQMPAPQEPQAPMSFDEWTSLGFSDVDEIVPNREYQVTLQRQTYRISIARHLSKAGSIWHSEVDRLSEESGSAIEHSWKQIVLPGGDISCLSDTAALRNVLPLLLKFVDSKKS